MPPHLRSQITVKCGLLHPCRGNMKIMLPLSTIARFLPPGSDGIFIMLVLLKQYDPSLRVAEHAGLQPCVAERAARVEPLHQADEVGMMLVEWSDCRGLRVEDLAPARSRLERGQGILDLGDHLVDRVWLALPGEMDADGVLLVVHAHPQPIRGHPANLAHLQDWSDSVERARTASMAPTACLRGTRYSDWISSPLLGV